MKNLLILVALLLCSQTFAAISAKEKSEIKHLLEIKLPKSYVRVLKGERKIRDLLDGPELTLSEKKELREFINSPVPRRIIPLVKGDRSLDDLGLREYYENAIAEEKAKNL